MSWLPATGVAQRKELENRGRARIDAYDKATGVLQGQPSVKPEQDTYKQEDAFMSG